MSRLFVIVGALAIVAIVLVFTVFTGEDEAATPPEPAPEMTAPAADIVDTAVAAGDFTTLATALEAAGLVETLKGDGPFTVFAPTDAAFAALPAGALDDLLADPKGALTDVLTYHVIAGRVMSGDLADGMTAATVQGGELTFTIKDGQAYVNDILISTADIEASNGVIHVIDGVLLPR